MMLKHQRYDMRVQRMSGYRIEVYWRADESGVGPCMSLYVNAKEAMRLDLFDPAHMHIAKQHRQPRIYFPANQTREQYIELGVMAMTTAYPQTARAAGWAIEMLGKVTGPATPVTAPARRAPARGRFRRR
jgi:hypothetical protein